MTHQHSSIADQIAQHRHAVHVDPEDAGAHALLGSALLARGQFEEAAVTLARALELDPKRCELHAALASVLFASKRYQDAAEHYRHALRVQDSFDLHQGLSDSLRQSGRIDEANASARRAAQLLPKKVPALLEMASTLHGQGRIRDTCTVLRRVLELDADLVDVYFDLAHLLYGAKQYREALDCLEQALARAPRHVKALRYRALCHHGLKNLDEAIASLELAVATKPDDAQLLAELGVMYHVNRRLPDAVASAGRALDRDARNLSALRTLTRAHFELGNWEEALGLARRSMAQAPTPDNHSMLLFILSHSCDDPEELTREHFAFGERWEAQAPRQPHANSRDPQRVLRVGLVSGDMYNHAVARFAAPILEGLKDSTQLQLYVYYNHTVEDDMTARLQATATWRRIAALDDAAAERLIRDDGIDILIDLSGHAPLNRLPLFARKPAPVQATWIGYAGTTGLRAMDYILCDRFIVPGTRYDSQFSEKVVKLPVGAPFLPQLSAPPVNELPALKNGYITFGSFHRASKLGRNVVHQWSSLLHAIPDSRMLLGGIQMGIDDVLVDWFASEGIPRERLLLRERCNVHDYLRQHHEVDICLSPFPYSGSTTVGHALWMGVPTLATVGATNPSHAAAAFMCHLGLNTFITDSPETYVKLGVFLSQNLPALAAMRLSMRERFLKSPLGYPGVAAAGMELALRRMWQAWCADGQAHPISVTLSDLANQ